MIGEVLPDDVVAVTFDQTGMSEEEALGSLFPVEAEQIGAAVQSRRIDFAAARACARCAMAELGVPPAPVVRGGRGMPIWPTGLVGTLTHTEGLRAAALATTDTVRSIGIDVEPHGPLPEGVLESISLPKEAQWVGDARADVSTVYWDRVLFTAKEATYKTWFPLTRRWLGFSDAQITLSTARVDDDGSASGALRSRILVDGHTTDGEADLVELTGRWAVRDGFAASAIVLRPDASEIAWSP